jgi:hypothetical protein
MAMYRDYEPRKPTRPRKGKIKQWTSVEREKLIKAKNIESVYKAAKEISDKENVPMEKIFVRRGWYSGVELHWTSPETDEEFARRAKENEKSYKAALKYYEEDKKKYDQWHARNNIDRLNKAVDGHEAAIDTIAEVLKRHPDVLDKAIAKVVKGK